MATLTDSMRSKGYNALRVNGVAAEEEAGKTVRFDTIELGSVDPSAAVGGR